MLECFQGKVVNSSRMLKLRRISEPHYRAKEDD
jgi:hypothetical protein